MAWSHVNVLQSMGPHVESMLNVPRANKAKTTPTMMIQPIRIGSCVGDSARSGREMVEVENHLWNFPEIPDPYICMEVCLPPSFGNTHAQHYYVLLVHVTPTSS